MWSKFVKQMLESIVSIHPKEARRMSRLKTFDIKQSTDLVRFVTSISLYADKDPKHQLDTCLTIIVDEFQELQQHNTQLLNTLQRLHEKMHNNVDAR